MSSRTKACIALLFAIPAIVMVVILMRHASSSAHSTPQWHMSGTTGRPHVDRLIQSYVNAAQTSTSDEAGLFMSLLEMADRKARSRSGVNAVCALGISPANTNNHIYLIFVMNQMSNWRSDLVRADPLATAVLHDMRWTLDESRSFSVNSKRITERGEKLAYRIGEPIVLTSHRKEMYLIVVPLGNLYVELSGQISAGSFDIEEINERISSIDYDPAFFERPLAIDSVHQYGDRGVFLIFR